MRSWNRGLLYIAAGAACLGGLQLALVAQQPARQIDAGQLQAQPKAAAGERLEFAVVQSFDARHAGDTPGHAGRFGELKELRPRVALGDAVFREEAKVGEVTGLGWSPVHGSLEVEFKPVDGVRVCVGDSVWLRRGGEPAGGK